MSPKKRLTENKGLPSRWRHRKGGYYYRVPPGLEHLWDGKTEFLLGKKLSDAYRAFSERIEHPERMLYVHDIANRYAMEVLPDKAPSTQKNETVYLSRIKRVFHNVPVDKLEPMHVYQFMDAAAREHGGTTANHMVALLSHMYTKAIEWGACREHPIKGKVVKRSVKVQRRVPELYEIDSALTVANETIRAYVTLKLMTGLRMTDMLSIQRSDIKEDGLHVTPSKTASSTGKALIFQWDEQNALWGAIEAIKSIRKNVPSFYLFCTRKGQPYIKADKSCNAFQSMWQRWQNKALAFDLIEERFSEKSLRNRVGSDAETAERAAELLAHSSTSTTRKHYRNSPVKVLPMVKK